MKISIEKNKKTKETLISYFKVKDKKAYRFGLLSEVTSDMKNAMTIIVDTNQRLEVQEFDEIEAVLKKSGIEYNALSVRANEKRLFGLPIDRIRKKKRAAERLFVFDINTEDFSGALYSGFLENYDIAICFGRKKELKEIADIAKEDLGEVLFNKEYFDDCIYSSALFFTIRSSIDISEKAKELIK